MIRFASYIVSKHDRNDKTLIATANSAYNSIQRNEVITMKMTANEFNAEVLRQKEKSPDIQIRYIAFWVDTNDYGSGMRRNWEYMHWISDMVCKYSIAHPDRVIQNAVGSASIRDQNDFTDFIISGVWRK